MTSSASQTQALIDELVRTTGAPDAKAAVRLKARELISLYVATFGEPVMPIDVDVLASLRGISRSEEPPVHSPDAELVPDGTGGVTMRVNLDRPDTRQRFSVAHEISHTFFPDYTTKVWCRTDARYRDRTNPDELLEMLCDIGAAELLFPHPWFSTNAFSVASGRDLAGLAATYRASREATVRRYAEVSRSRWLRYSSRGSSNQLSTQPSDEKISKIFLVPIRRTKSATHCGCASTTRLRANHSSPRGTSSPKTSRWRMRDRFTTPQSRVFRATENATLISVRHQAHIEFGGATLDARRSAWCPR